MFMFGQKYSSQKLPKQNRKIASAIRQYPRGQRIGYTAKGGKI
jgi:hypothetical protein